MTDAPDYNDGKWHGWSGGKCPVDPLAFVEIMYSNGDKGCSAGEAGPLRWSRIDSIGDIVAFRVTKPAPPKPREFWVVLGENHIHTALPWEPNAPQGPAVHVREVLPE